MKSRHRSYFYPLMLVTLAATLIGYAGLVFVVRMTTLQAAPYSRLITTVIFGAGLCWIALERGIAVQPAQLFPVVSQFALIGTGAVIGVFADAPDIYLWANTAYLMIQLLGFIVFADERYSIQEMENATRFFDSGMLLVNCLILVWQFTGLATIPSVLLPFVYGGMVWSALRGRWGNVLVSAVVIGISVPQMNRTSIVMWAAVLPTLLLAMRAMVGRLVGFLIVISVLTVGAFAAYQSGMLKETHFERRISDLILEIQVGERTVAIDQRFYELRVIRNKFSGDRNSWLRMLTGYGTGSVIDLSGTEDSAVRGSQPTDVSTTHNIHILPAALLYRYGILGTIWWVLLIAVGCYYLLDTAVYLRWAANDPRALLSFVCFLFCLMLLVEGMVASSHFLSNVFVGSIFALGVTGRKWRTLAAGAGNSSGHDDALVLRSWERNSDEAMRQLPHRHEIMDPRLRKNLGLEDDEGV